MHSKPKCTVASNFHKISLMMTRALISKARLIMPRTEVFKVKEYQIKALINATTIITTFKATCLNSLSLVFLLPKLI